MDKAHAGVLRRERNEDKSGVQAHSLLHAGKGVFQDSAAGGESLLVGVRLDGERRWSVVRNFAEGNWRDAKIRPSYVNRFVWFDLELRLTVSSYIEGNAGKSLHFHDIAKLSCQGHTSLIVNSVYLFYWQLLLQIESDDGCALTGEITEQEFVRCNIMRLY